MKTNSVVITTIIALIILELGAMHYGINGGFRTLIVGIIAGLGGWRIKVKDE